MAFSNELVKIARPGPSPVGKSARIIYEKLRKGSPVKIRITKDADKYGGGAFDFDKKEIMLSKKDYDVLAHELGHAELHESTIGKLLQNRATNGAYFLSGMGGFAGGMITAAGKSWGLLLPAALTIPTLIAEGIASYKGHSMIDEHGATGKQKQLFRSNMLKAFSTYLTLPVLGTLIAVAGAHSKAY